jgi:hypothetical protein
MLIVAAERPMNEEEYGPPELRITGITGSLKALSPVVYTKPAVFRFDQN